LSFADSPIGDALFLPRFAGQTVKGQARWPAKFARKAIILRGFSTSRPPGTFAPLSGYRSGILQPGLGMSDTYIIEVGSQPAGIVVRNPEGYMFFAAAHRFNSLDGQIFRNAREAEQAARRIAYGSATLAA
jgi:hypothetical protein